MMKILLSLFFTLFLNISAHAGPDSWPWGSEMPFPWKGIQGTWSFKSDEQMYYMAFKVVRNSTGSNQLELVLYQANNCKVVADGGGFEDSDLGDHVVRGMLKSPKGIVRLMTIHVFSDSTMKEIYGEDWSPEGKRSKSYTVLNVSSTDTDHFETYQLEKIHTNPYGVCPFKKR